MENLTLKCVESLEITKNGVSENKKKQNLEENVFDDIIAKSVDEKEAVKKDRDVKNNDKNNVETVSSLNIALGYNVNNNNTEDLNIIKNEKNKIKTGLEVSSSTFNKNLKILYKNQPTITKFTEPLVNTENSRKFKNGAVLGKSGLGISSTLTVNENLNKQIHQNKDFKLAMESLEIRQQKLESIMKSSQFQDKISPQMESIKQRENLNVIKEGNLQNLKIILKKLNKTNNLVDNKNKSNSDVNDKLQKDIISNLLKKKEEFEKLASEIEDKKSEGLKEFNILKSNKEPGLEISINNFNENLETEGLQSSNEVNIYTNKNNDENYTAATNYNDNLLQLANINISNPNDSNSNYQNNNQNDSNFNKNMNGQNQNSNTFIFSYNQTNISANLASNVLSLVINTKDVVLDNITILQIQQILKDSGFRHYNMTIKDKEKVLKLYEYKAPNDSNTFGINLAV
ncbi:MAG: hypothetical protein JHC31_05805 [Sulfurihydrogenibium sp.]|jgi:hypothetical protein|nr:hypothetical protein [Sulfurihydrogenibium sp.]